MQDTTIPRLAAHWPWLAVGAIVGLAFGWVVSYESTQGNAGGWVMVGVFSLVALVGLGLILVAIVLLLTRRWKALANIASMVVGAIVATPVGSILGPG